MKKFLFTVCCVACIGFQSHSQTISEHALGLRFGGNNGYGAEVSYQGALGSNNRLELDFGWRNDKNFDAYKLTGLYQWVWNIEGGFNWYVGLGGGVGNVNYDNRFNNDDFDDDDEFFLFGAGNIGIEYNFNIPLLIALDFRPEIGSGRYNNDLDFDIALALRYQF
jgi:opacity protein-like surface antigen